MFLTPQETTLAAAAIAVAAALLGVYLTARRDDRRVRQERERQDAMERDRWTREDRAIWGERRFEAHTAFAHATLEALRYCESAGEYAPELGNAPRDPESVSSLMLRNRAVSDALVMLELRASAPVREAAEKYKAATPPLVKALGRLPDHFPGTEFHDALAGLFRNKTDDGKKLGGEVVKAVKDYTDALAKLQDAAGQFAVTVEH